MDIIKYNDGKALILDNKDLREHYNKSYKTGDRALTINEPVDYVILLNTMPTQSLPKEIRDTIIAKGKMSTAYHYKVTEETKQLLRVEKNKDDTEKQLSMLKNQVEDLQRRINQLEEIDIVNLVNRRHNQIVKDIEHIKKNYTPFGNYEILEREVESIRRHITHRDDRETGINQRLEAIEEEEQE